MWGDDTATSISMALTPYMKPPEWGKERWIQSVEQNWACIHIGSFVSKEAGVGESKDRATGSRLAKQAREENAERL